MKSVFLAIILIFTTVLGAAAQQVAWIQIEAHPTLREAEARARAYAGVLDDVNGFRMKTGWYAVALGPYDTDTAGSALNRLRATGEVPNDSYLADGTQFRQQFWPVGQTTLSEATVPATAPPPTPTTPATQDPAAVMAEAAPMALPDETKAQARNSERALDRPAREALQIALKWEGFYNSGIDGAFGPGTRRAMADYQAAKGYDETGILTTNQRAELLAGYQAVIDSLGMQTVFDQDAGIAVPMPVTMVSFSHYEAPFAHYDPTANGKVRVVLISQKGNQDTLFGLYDILQTLEIVPLEGARTRRNSEFTLTGENADIVSYTYAKLVDGAVKGFTLIWPTGDEKRRSLALTAMKTGFESLGDTALADTAGLDEAAQSLDLLSGLEIRRPDIARSGFYVDASGAVLTTAQVVGGGCQRVTIDDTYEADITAVDDTLGVAILKPTASLSPSGVASFLTGAPRLHSDIAVSGYSYGGRLGAPTLTFGTLAELAGLGGETYLARLSLAPQAGDAGGPVLDSTGAVLGMLTADPDDATRQLPQDVHFAANAGALAQFLSENGVQTTATDPDGAMDPVDMTTLAENMTVLVSCWN